MNESRPNRMQRIRARARGGSAGGEAIPTRTAPPIPEAVVEWLEELYPDQAPNTKLSHPEMIECCAEVALVRHVRRVYDSQSRARDSVGAALTR